MRHVGAYEAKTHLAALLDRVEEGERITITRHGRPVAVLAPAAGLNDRPVAETVARIIEERSGRTLGRDLSVHDLITTGRR
ncbi:MAG: type II toxin-antitoxin system prevent-host-death family antitoxin [Gemmatimonadota bacterium]